MRFPRLWVFLVALVAASPALAQSSLLQAGPVTPGHQPMYSGSGSSQPLVQDGGGSGGGGLKANPGEIGITSRSPTNTYPSANSGHGPNGEHACLYDAPTNNATGYHYFCMDPNAAGGGLMSYGKGGLATALPFTFILNGVPYSFPFTAGSGVVGPSTTTVGDLAVWNNTSGTLLADGGPLVFSSIPGNLPSTKMPALTGDVTSTAGTVATTIASGAVTSGKMASGAAAANVGTLTGDLAGSTLPANTISAGAVTGSKIAANTIGDGNIAANAIAYDSLAQSAGNTVVGNASGVTANKADVSVPSCSSSSQLLQWVTNVGFQCASIPNGFITPWAITGGLPSGMSGTSTTAVMTISALSAADQSNTVYIGWTLSKSWTVTNGNAINGSADGTTLTASATYHMYDCHGTSGDGSYASRTAPGTFLPANCPSGYQAYTRRIFSFTTSGAGAPNPYTADEVAGGSVQAWLTTPVLDINGLTPTTTRTLYALSTPTGVKNTWTGRFTPPGAASGACNLVSPDEPDLAPSPTTNAGADVSAGSVELAFHMPLTDASAHLGVRCATAGSSMNLSTAGWVDFRRS